MYLYIHFITALVLTAIFYPFVGLHSLWIMVGGFLIDFDHYLYTLFRFKRWSIAFSYEYHNDSERIDRERNLMHIFHTVEFWTFMVLAAIFSYAAGWLFFFWMFTLTFIGMILHLTLDFIALIKAKRMDIRALSLISWLRKNKYL